jgi:hypothetical protein
VCAPAVCSELAALAQQLAALAPALATAVTAAATVADLDSPGHIQSRMACMVTSLCISLGHQLQLKGTACGSSCQAAAPGRQGGDPGRCRHSAAMPCSAKKAAYPGRPPAHAAECHGRLHGASESLRAGRRSGRVCCHNGSNWRPACLAGRSHRQPAAGATLSTPGYDHMAAERSLSLIPYLSLPSSCSGGLL